MTTSIHAVADCFILFVDHSTGDSINLFKLQKMVYYAQAWYLTLHRKALFDGEIEAWVHGPVSPELHKRFHHFADHPIDRDAVVTDVNKLDAAEKDFLDEVWTVYGQYSVSKLEKMTHSEKPWQEARADLPPHIRGHNVISQETMRDFYSCRITARRRIREY